MEASEAKSSDRQRPLLLTRSIEECPPPPPPPPPPRAPPPSLCSPNSHPILARNLRFVKSARHMIYFVHSGDPLKGSSRDTTSHPSFHPHFSYVYLPFILCHHPSNVGNGIPHGRAASYRLQSFFFRVLFLSYLSYSPFFSLPAKPCRSLFIFHPLFLS